MIFCLLQYILIFANLLFVGSFCAYSLCCQPKGVQFGRKVKALILMPLFPAVFTAGVATFYVFTKDEAECIFFGSEVAMLAIDIGNQIIFVIGAVFISTMEVVFTKIRAGRLAQSPEETQGKLVQIKRNLWSFTMVYLVAEVVILTLKGVIYFNNTVQADARLGPIPITFLVLHGLRAVFPVTLTVKFDQQLRVYLAEFKVYLSHSQKMKTVTLAVLVTTLLVFSAIWYNFAI